MRPRRWRFPPSSRPQGTRCRVTFLRPADFALHGPFVRGWARPRARAGPSLARPRPGLRVRGPGPPTPQLRASRCSHWRRGRRPGRWQAPGRRRSSPSGPRRSSLCARRGGAGAAKLVIRDPRHYEERALPAVAGFSGRGAAQATVAAPSVWFGLPAPGAMTARVWERYRGTRREGPAMKVAATLRAGIQPAWTAAPLAGAKSCHGIRTHGPGERAGRARRALRAGWPARSRLRRHPRGRLRQRLRPGWPKTGTQRGRGRGIPADVSGLSCMMPSGATQTNAPCSGPQPRR